MTPSPEAGRAATLGPRLRADGHAWLPISEGWQAAAAEPGLDPVDVDGLDWIAAEVPGTAASALRGLGDRDPGEEQPLDECDWWFRTRFTATAAAGDEQVVLRLEGIATVADVYLNGTALLHSESMFVANAIDVGARLEPDNELLVRCRALAPLLDLRRRPRARWRTRVAASNLRFLRTTLLGRAPGFAPRPAAVGPWRPIVLERRRRFAIERCALRPRLEDDDGVLAVELAVRGLGSAPPSEVAVTLTGPTGAHQATLELTRHAADMAVGVGQLVVPAAARWWPHTHGEPALYEAQLELDGEGGGHVAGAARVGFRTLAPGPAPEHDLERSGLDLHVNGVRVFARGAVWTPTDAVSLNSPPEELRRMLELLRDAGLNMVRLQGTGVYEVATFHDLCDELGLLVWQDFMFANFDYPIADPTFRAQVQVEAQQLLDALAGRPSLAVLCGNSEVEQQAAMYGQQASLARGELFGELLPGLVTAQNIDAIYVPSAPCGGDAPFRTDRGLANYFGVGAYRRPLEDARRAEVRFASECLAFSNMPDDDALGALGLGTEAAIVGPRWKAGIPRDAGSDWDFEDVRDHYLQLLYGVEAATLRSTDPDRYVALSRAVSGEVMAEVFGEWRRQGSPCGGGLVLWWRDLVAGAGWGLVDHRGEPKVAYHHLRRALAPVAVWTTDEGLNGLVAHVGNDRPAALTAQLRVAAYRDFEHRTLEARRPIDVGPHEGCSVNLEELLGAFADLNWVYRFGPPSHDVVVVSLETPEDDAQLISQALRYPVGRPLTVEDPECLGLQAWARREPADGGLSIVVASRRLAYGVRVRAPGFVSCEDAFDVEPGSRRVLRLRPRRAEAVFSGAVLTALNLRGTMPVEPAGARA